MALAERGAPVAQAVLVTIGMRGSADGSLGLGAYRYVVGTGHARKAGKVHGKQQGKQTHLGKGRAAVLGRRAVNDAGQN